MRNQVTYRNLRVDLRPGLFTWLAVGTLLMLSIVISQTANAQQRPVDVDRDGHASAQSGGDDCDDRDPRRYPGNAEVRDFVGHDEDCDPTTYSNQFSQDGDVDHDGEVDYRCFNRDINGIARRGSDYDDNNPAIRRGSMICDGPDNVVMSGSFLPSVKCPTGTKCVVQPNGTGVCMIEPAGYMHPKPFEMFVLPAPVERLSPAVVPSTRVTAPTEPASSAPSQVELCKSTLQSGKISWGGGTVWAPVNIDKLCNGTKNAKETIDCFQSNVEALSWEKAIDKCM